MFGLGFGEVVLLIIVAIVVVGPRQLPSMMRTAGQWVSRIRRMSSDLRAQSGIDQLMRDEGIDRSIQEIRALQNINVLDGLERMAQSAPVAPPARAPGATSGPELPSSSEPKTAIAPDAQLPIASTEKPSEYSPDEPAQDKPTASPAALLEEQPGKVAREREYPRLGCDAYGALPDDAAPYGAVATTDPMTSGVKVDSSAGGAAST